MAGGTEISSLCSNRTVKMFLKSEGQEIMSNVVNNVPQGGMIVVCLTFFFNGSKEYGIHLKLWHLGQIENINTQFVLPYR